MSTEIDVPIEEQAAAAEEFTRGLVEAFDLGGTVVTVIDAFEGKKFNSPNDVVTTYNPRSDNRGAGATITNFHRLT